MPRKLAQLSGWGRLSGSCQLAERKLSARAVAFPAVRTCPASERYRRGARGGMSVIGNTIETKHLPKTRVGEAGLGPRAWTTACLRQAALADGACALMGGLLAAQVRFSGERHLPAAYLGFSYALPALWWTSVLLAAAMTRGSSGLAPTNSAGSSTRRSA